MFHEAKNLSVATQEAAAKCEVNTPTFVDFPEITCSSYCIQTFHVFVAVMNPNELPGEKKTKRPTYDLSSVLLPHD